MGPEGPGGGLALCGRTFRPRGQARGKLAGSQLGPGTPAPHFLPGPSAAAIRAGPHRGVESGQEGALVLGEGRPWTQFLPCPEAPVLRLGLASGSGEKVPAVQAQMGCQGWGLGARRARGQCGQPCQDAHPNRTPGRQPPRHWLILKGSPLPTPLPAGDTWAGWGGSWLGRPPAIWRILSTACGGQAPTLPLSLHSLMFCDMKPGD